MAQKGIREYYAKNLVERKLSQLTSVAYFPPRALVTQATPLEGEWLAETKINKLVVKPDQLIGKKGKNNLMLLNASLDQARDFIKQNLGKEVTIGKTSGRLTHYLVEPFVKHEREYYVAFKQSRDFDEILYSPNGGVDIEENWESVATLRVPVLGSASIEQVKALVASAGKTSAGKTSANNASNASEVEQKIISEYINALYAVYKELEFSFLELNPFAIVDGKAIALGMVGKLDDTAGFEQVWDGMEFPAPFGRDLTSEEAFVKQLDDNSGASLKLTVLNPSGRIWPMVAGGGASVVYADTVVDLDYGKELALYGEYSGDPNEEETYQYAKTLLGLMTRTPGRKALLIGGGIANFTDVAKTFAGIIRALREHAVQLKDKKIFVRRGGPNYAEGLAKMRALGQELGIEIEVYGPETHMTAIVDKAIKWLETK